MGLLEQVTEDKERLASRKAKLLSDLDKVEEQFKEAEGAERYLRRVSGVALAPAAGGAPRRGRPTKAAKQSADGAPSVSEMILNVVGHMPAGGTREDIATALKVAGMEPRANHLGIALQRHLRADRLVEMDGRYQIPHPKNTGPQYEDGAGVDEGESQSGMPSSAETRDLLDQAAE